MSEQPLTILEVVDLKKVFRSGQEELVVFEGVNLSVTEGTTVVITGESGSGKTTFLNLIGALDTVSRGKIIYRDEEITDKAEADLIDYRSRSLGFIFQFHYLLKDLTAIENVLMPALIVGMQRSQARRRAGELLERVGLGGRLHHYPLQLSGGERQRVAVARALMNDPQLILADEPTGNLDERNSRAIQELLFELVAAYSKTMILVTHGAELASAGRERYLLQHGRLRRL
jgi:lipoprotein-releasing system ATP-binding protein